MKHQVDKARTARDIEIYRARLKHTVVEACSCKKSWSARQAAPQCMGAAQVAYRARRKSEGRELLTFCLRFYAWHARPSAWLCSRTNIFPVFIFFFFLGIRHVFLSGLWKSRNRKQTIRYEYQNFSHIHIFYFNKYRCMFQMCFLRSWTQKYFEDLKIFFSPIWWW
jgi:hypothetical protein